MKPTDIREPGHYWLRTPPPPASPEDPWETTPIEVRWDYRRENLVVLFFGRDDDFNLDQVGGEILGPARPPAEDPNGVSPEMLTAGALVLEESARTLPNRELAQAVYVAMAHVLNAAGVQGGGDAKCPACDGTGVAREAQGSAWPFPCPTCSGTGANGVTPTSERPAK